MPFHIEILDRSLQGSLAAFLALFVLIGAAMAVRARRRRPGVDPALAEEYRSRFPGVGQPEHPPTAPPLLPAFWAAFWVSVAAGTAIFLALAFTPLSPFPNFADAASDRTQKLELNRLQTTFEAGTLQVEGRVVNIGPQALAGLAVHLLLYGPAEDLRGVRTLELQPLLEAGAGADFAFREPEAADIRRIAVTFASRHQPVLHREDPALLRPAVP